MLTDTQAWAAQPRETEYSLLVGGCEGLILRVFPSGVKSFAFRYKRPSDGQGTSFAIGKYSTPKMKRGDGMSVKAARAKGRKERDKVDEGIDPKDKKTAARNAWRMDYFFGAKDDEGWFLSEYVDEAGKLEGTRKAEASIASDRSVIRVHLRSRPALMRKLVVDVRVSDLLAVMKDKNVGPGSWRKALNILRVCFYHAEEMKVIPFGDSPTRNKRLKPKKEKSRDRYVTPVERANINAGVEAAEKAGPGVTGGMSASHARAIRLLLLTGMRAGGVQGLRWEHIDWNRGVLNLSTSKTGPKTGSDAVPLMPSAIKFLEVLRDTCQQEGRLMVGYVCPSTNGGRLTNLRRTWENLRVSIGLDGSDGRDAVTLHTLRHSWASDAISAGVSLAVIAKVLSQSLLSVTQKYAHLHNPALTEGLKIADAAIKLAEQTKPTVVPIMAGRRKRKKASK